MESFDVYTREFGLIIVGSIVFVASLLWRDFIMELENILFPNHDAYNLIFRLLYVVIITFILVYVAIRLKILFGIYTEDNETSHLSKKDEDIVYKKLQE